MKKRIGRYGWIVGIVVAGWIVSAEAEVRLHRVFSDHMVLQRDIAAPVWGWADAGETVTVTMAGQTLSATADKDGRWEVKLAPLSANDKPQELTVSAKSGTVVVRDVLVGDVWLCSGQSNMQFGLGGSDNASNAVATATNNLIRLMMVDSPRAVQPVDDVPKPWAVCAPGTAGGFSAVGYFFGRTLQTETGIPIGLIGNAWGGTMIELWMPVEAPAAYPPLARLNQDFAKRLADFDTQLRQSIEPAGRWVEQARQAQARGERLPLPPVLPAHPALDGLGGIYYGRVTPLIPFGIKGVIWYQGESNGSDGDLYIAKMQALVGSWRKAWGQGDFPFYYVQLANWQLADQNPAGGTGWAQTRVAQLKCLKLIPHSGMASAIDIGDAADIHPRNKEDVGTRLALWALKNDYGRKDVVCSGPLYKDMAVEGSTIRVSFDYAEGGLMAGRKIGHGPAVEAKDDPLTRFAIAGTNRVWCWAKAVVDGSTVVVSSTNVPAPVAVRYAFSMNPEGCNLYNKEGLPASPFRSDSW